jgi:hypothetical protein
LELEVKNFFCSFKAFTDVAGCPAPAMLLMQKLLAMPPKSLWQVAHSFISHFRSTLNEAVPRQVQGMFRVLESLKNLYPVKKTNFLQRCIAKFG